MTTTEDSREFFDRLAAFHERLVEELAPQLVEKPELAEVITERLEKIRDELEDNALQTAPPPDGGLAQLIGLGDAAADETAKAILTEAFPDRTIEQIAIDGIASGGGSIHCATQQEPEI